jgi:hypothetical protein
MNIFHIKSRIEGVYKVHIKNTINTLLPTNTGENFRGIPLALLNLKILSNASSKCCSSPYLQSRYIALLSIDSLQCCSHPKVCDYTTWPNITLQSDCLSPTPSTSSSLTEIAVLLPIARAIFSDLLLDVCALGISQCKCGFGSLAWCRLQLHSTQDIYLQLARP